MRENKYADSGLSPVDVYGLVEFVRQRAGNKNQYSDGLRLTSIERARMRAIRDRLQATIRLANSGYSQELAPAVALDNQKKLTDQILRTRFVMRG